MALPLTRDAEQLLQKTGITPQIVLQIDGVDTLYGAVEIKEYWRIGDPNREVGEPFLTIGGQVSVDDQESLVSWTGGTSNSISQVLNVDKGTNDSVSTLKIALIDLGLKATKLITPGQVVEDVLGRRAKVWLGEASGSWKDDYVIIFRGLIDDIDAKSGIVTLNLNQGSNLTGATFLPGETALDGAIDDTVTTATVLTTADFLSPFTNLGGTIDTSLKLYVRIDDEIMRYESTTGTTFDTITRGQLGTIAAAHSDEATVNSFYRITGNAIDLALKLMLSGQTDPYLEDFTVKSFQVITASLTVANAIFIADRDLEREFNIRVGDYVTTTGATNGLNNVTNRVITEINVVDSGSYFILDGAALANEATTAALVSFNSQYDTWGPNAGLGLRNEEVDILEHLSVQSKFLSSAEYDFYLKEEIEDGKEFIATEIYNPVSAYGIPRKASASIGYNIGPIPGVLIKTLDKTNVTNASKMSIKRTTNKNFFNTIIYKFEEDALEDQFSRGTVFIDGTSVTRIPTGNKPLTIVSKGLREILSAINIAQIASSRRLKRYRFGAEQISEVTTDFSTGFNLEVGDKIILDMTDLQVTDIQSGTRSGASRIYEITNKELGIRDGSIKLKLLDTNFDLDARYCLIGPASIVKSGTSGTEFIIDPSFNTTVNGTAEWKKWTKFTDTEVVVSSPDYSIQGRALLNAVTSNTITVASDLGFTPLAGYIIELGDFDNQTTASTVAYGFMSDGSNNFADGSISYKMS